MPHANNFPFWGRGIGVQFVSAGFSGQLNQWTHGIRSGGGIFSPLPCFCPPGEVQILAWGLHPADKGKEGPEPFLPQFTPAIGPLPNGEDNAARILYIYPTFRIGMLLSFRVI